ncbi:hypothetical protein Hanom_Chr00s003213g01710691 [Helianthus anomalus]
MQKKILMRGLSFLCSLNKTPSFCIHNKFYYTSKSDSSSENPNPHHSENEIHDVDDVSRAGNLILFSLTYSCSLRINASADAENSENPPFFSLSFKGP